MSISQREAQNRPEVSEKKRLAHTGVPKSPLHRAAIKKAVSSPSARAKKSAIAKIVQNRPQVLAKQRNSHLGVRQSESHRIANREAQKIAQNRPEVKAANRARSLGKLLKPCHREAIKNAMRRPEVSKKLRESAVKRVERLGPNRPLCSDTKPERVFEKILTGCGIKFEKQKRFGRFTVDFFLPGLKQAIEIDGIYWHRRKVDWKEQQDKRDRYLIDAGVTSVFHITDKDVGLWDKMLISIPTNSYGTRPNDVN